MFDPVGVLILVLLVIASGFLAVRAWRAKNAVLKWGGGILTSLLTLVAAAALVLALVGFAKLNRHYSNPVPDIPVTRGSEQIARGQRLAAVCVSCHTSNNQLPLAGANFVAKFEMPPLGTLYAPNLTPNGDIKDWSDGELIRAIRAGVHKNGRSLLVMPASALRNLSDDDAAAIIAYLRSQPPTGGPTPTNRLSVLGAIFTNIADFRTAQPPVGHVAAPSADITPEYGKYMVGILGCADCHGPQLAGKVNTGQPGPPPGPNLTQIVPQWTEEQFMTFFNTGKRPDGSTVPLQALSSGFSEPRMPWPEFRAAATDDELRAMYAYLHSLPSVASPGE